MKQNAKLKNIFKETNKTQIKTQMFFQFMFSVRHEAHGIPGTVLYLLSNNMVFCVKNVLQRLHYTK